MGVRYDNGLIPLVAAFIAKASAGGASPEQIQQAVDDYLSKNPVTAGGLELSGSTIKMTEGGN